MTNMSSSSLTYGKKRGLFRSLGSRRHQKHLTDSFATKSKEPLVISSPISMASPRRTSRKRSNPQASNAEESASALLDDSSIGPQYQDSAKLLSDAAAAKEEAVVASRPSEDASETMDNHLATPPYQSPLLEKLSSSSDSRTRTSRVEKHSPKASKRAGKQSSYARQRAESSQRRKDSGLLRPLPSSRTLSLDPFTLHPTNNLRASSSVPLCAANVNVTPLKTGDQGQATAREPASADEVNQKVHAMLAATNALKPSVQIANPSTSRLTRMVPSKVMAKVSNVLDRFQTKSTSLNSRDQAKTSAPLEHKSDDRLLKTETSTQGQSPTDASSIRTIEIRLNEGDNLNKKKVQKIVGGNVARKPVADDGKSLRSGKSFDDPFAEPGRSRTPTTFESRLKRGGEVDDNDIPPLPRNPFESEKEFDNNIEDSILSSSPVGSSTPRIRVQRPSTSSSNHSPILHWRAVSANSQKNLRPNALTLKSYTNEFTRTETLGFTALGGGDSADAFRDSDANVLGGAKKHPSPSKEALEDLEKAFRRYRALKVAGADQDELDELATSYVPPSPSLTPARLSTSNLLDIESPKCRKDRSRPLSISSSAQLSCIPRSTEHSLKVRSEIRLAPPYRPTTLQADDVDELQ